MLTGYLHSTERPSSLLRLLLGVRYFLNSHRVWAACVLTFFHESFLFFLLDVVNQMVK